MHKCNIFDKASKQESKLHPVICNAKSPQVQTHFQRHKLSVWIPRAWSQIKTHDQLHVLVRAEAIDVDAEYTLLNLMSGFQFTLLLALHATHVQLLEVFCVLPHCNKWPHELAPLIQKD